MTRQSSIELIKSILTTPPIDLTVPDSGFEVHSLTSTKHILYYLWGIKSLIKLSGLRPTVVIHDDGTLTSGNIDLLVSHLPGAKIIRANQADVHVLQRLRGYPSCIKYRQNEPFAKKVFDVFFYSKSQKVLILDSDILFINRTSEIINWVNSGDKQILYNHDPIDSEVRMHQKIKKGLNLDYISGYNSGLQCTFTKVFNIDLFEAYLTFLYNHNLVDWVTEQRGMSLLAHQYGRCRPLSRDRYFFQNRKSVYYNRRKISTFNRELVAKHYSRYSRSLFISEGINYLVNSGFL